MRIEIESTQTFDTITSSSCHRIEKKMGYQINRNWKNNIDRYTYIFKDKGYIPVERVLEPPAHATFSDPWKEDLITFNMISNLLEIDWKLYNILNFIYDSLSLHKNLVLHYNF